MGKKRKTYKEKIIADLRRKVYSLEAQKPNSWEAKESKIISSMPFHNKATTVPINSHIYLSKDIFKTGILTASVIGIQIILFLILKKHILVLPGVSY